MKFVRIAACASLVLAWAGGAFAQQSVHRASLSGQVRDASGGALPGASVDARHVETNVSTAAVTDAEGRFRFPYLQAGDYEVVARLEGFRDAVRHLSLTAGSAFDVPFQLELAGIETSLSVTADAAVLEAARSQVAATITATEVRSVPMNGRVFLDLGLLLPGVAPAGIASTQLFPETSAVPGNGLSVAGQRNLSNNFTVDGLSANDDAAGLSGMTYAVDAIEQFQIVTSGGQAELGRALGGYVNVLTRSGTNTPAGSAYGFFRDDALNAPNALTGTTLPMRQWQAGATLGGPIVRNRTFYFGSVEHRRLDQSGLVTIDEDVADAINTRLDEMGYPGARVATGLYDNPIRTANVLAKIDHNAGEQHRLGLRYVLYDASARHARGAGGLSAATASQRLDNLDQSGAVHHTMTLSPRAVIENRAQIEHSRLDAPPTDAVGPAVSIAGVASFGTLSSSPAGRDNTLYQAVSNLSYLAGAHALRAGVDIGVNDSLIYFPRARRGAYTFASLQAFLDGRYNNAGFTQTFGDTSIAQASTSVGTYLQDEWHAAEGLTFNLGLRYDVQFLETIDTDTDNIAPRVGFAWAPFGSLRTIVRGNAGLYYDRVPLRALANALLSAGNTTDLDQLRQIGVALSPGQAGAPVFPAVLDAPVTSVTLPNLSTMDRQLQHAVSRQASVEIEHELSAGTTISAAYQYTRGDNLLMAINQNVPSCVPRGGNNGCRPVAEYANNSQYTGAGESSYHGLLMSLVQRPAPWGGYRLSYTLSKSMNNVGEYFFSGPIDPFDLSKDWARADGDRRHRFVAHVYGQRADGLHASVLLRAYSAAPFNITSGVTTLQGTSGRPIVNGSFIERNAGTGRAFFSLDAKVAHVVRAGATDVEVSLEAFNLTNHTNVIAMNGNFGQGLYPDAPAAGFGAITAVDEPRTVQLGLRVRF